MSRKKQKSHYLAPRNWPIWLLIGLLRLLILLPFKIQIYLGKRLGRLSIYFPTKIRSTSVTNLRLSFPELDDSKRQQLLEKNFEAVGISIFETALGWWGDPKKLLPLVNITGLKHVQNALAKGNGVIICAAHFTSLHLAARLLALNFPVALMYRPQKNPVINKVIHKIMANNFKRAIQREQIRDMVRTLKNNIAICYTPDIDAGTQNSLFIPFFNIPTATITATSRLAKLTQTAVIPIEFYRRADNSGYEIELKAALENFPTDDLVQDTLRINQIIEQAVRRFPEQYIWQYKRYKTRPEGEKKIFIGNIMTYANQKLLQHSKFILTCVLLGVVARLLPHPPNVTPLIALSLFAGSQFPRKIACIMVLAIMLLSDGLLACLQGFAWFGNWSIFTYSGVLVITLIANQLIHLKKQILIYIFSSASGFWCWTNFGVWLCSGLYPQTINGLLNCYIAALPFLQNALIGDLIWSGVIFGSFKYLSIYFQVQKKLLN